MVYTGFKPASLFIKNVITQGLIMYDNKRNGFNNDNKLLRKYNI